MRVRNIATLALATLGVAFAQPSGAQGLASRSVQRQLERGRYLVLTGHCNNCHTAGYTKREGNVPEKQWLLGSSPLGYRGPWGTTYASNLRLSVQSFTEDEWVQYAKVLRARLPMPWWSLKEMSKPDLRALYQFIKSLGPAGEPANPYVPADQEPPKPYEARQLVQ